MAPPRKFTTFSAGSNWIRAGTELEINGPSLLKDIGPLLPYPPPPDPDCVQPARHLHEALLAHDGPTNSSTPWIFRVRSLDTGGIGCIQTWNGSVHKKGSEVEYDVKVFLAQPLCFPDWSVENIVDQMMTPGMYLEKDAAFFHTYRKLQGMELDINYGLYSVKVPGERHKCSMMLMESTTHLHSDESLSLLNQRTRGEVASIKFSGHHGPSSYTPTVFAAMMRTYKRLQRRFLSCEPTLLPSFTTLLPLETSTPSELHLLILPPKTIRYYEDSKAMVREVLRNNRITENLHVRSRRKIYEQRISDLLLCVQMKIPQDLLMETWAHFEMLKVKHGLSW